MSRVLSWNVSRGRLRPGTALVCVLALTASCGRARSSGSPAADASTPPDSSPPDSPTPPDASAPFGIPAKREAYTSDPTSSVSHDTETDALVVHAGRLFAGTDQWEYPGTQHGHLLRKDSSAGAWTVVEQTVARIEALDSFAVPADQGLGPGHAVLVTQAIIAGQSEVQWLLDGATSFNPSDSYVLASSKASVRAFGAHEDNGAWAVYAGVNPTGILRGLWSASTHTLTFDPAPELHVAAGSSTGDQTQKVTGFADCGGALYATLNTKLYRRNDGSLPSGTPRWALVYQSGPAVPYNSGLRGLTCVTHGGSPSLLVSTEGNGKVYRFDKLPQGQVDSTMAGPAALAPTLEFTPVDAITKMLAGHGTTIPSSGSGSIGYVIAAYNNGEFDTVKIDGANRQIFGFEWGYLGGCPPTRKCGPTALKLVTFDAAACFAIRTDSGNIQTYALHCLDGPDFALPGKVSNPIRAGEAFVSIRTTQLSPFGDGRFYLGGYDCDFHPADGTAWVATSSLGDL